MKEELQDLVYRLRKNLYTLIEHENELSKLGNEKASCYKQGRIDATGSIICDLVDLLRENGVEHFPCPTRSE